MTHEFHKLIIIDFLDLLASMSNYTDIYMKAIEDIKVWTYALILEGLVPSTPPTIDMLLIFTSDVNLSETKIYQLSSQIIDHTHISQDASQHTVKL